MSTASAKAGSHKSSSPDVAPPEGALQPWQFFLLGGMLAATAVVMVATGQAPANIIALSITVVSISFVGLGAYRMLAPLVAERVDTPITVGGRTRLALEREKNLVLRSIKELEFDFAMGKIAKADFDDMAARLKLRAVGLMQQLDQSSYRQVIEKEVAQRLEAQGIAHHAPATDTCPACGTPHDHDAKFCKHCGAKL